MGLKTRFWCLLFFMFLWSYCPTPINGQPSFVLDNSDADYFPEHIIPASTVNSSYVSEELDESNITQISSIYEFWSSLLRVVIRDNYAYLVDSYAGLIIIDISDMENPFVAGYLALPAGVNGITFDDDYAYLSISTGIHWEHSGVLTVDVSDPTNPVEVDHRSLGGNPRDIETGRSNLYVALGWHGIAALNISSPGVLDFMMYRNQGEIIERLVYSDSLLYTTHNAFGIVIYNLNGFSGYPVDPVFYNTGTAPNGLHLMGDTLFQASVEGVGAYDISDLENISELGFSESNGFGYECCVQDSVLYLADRSGGLSVLSISDLDQIVEYTSFHNVGSVKDVANNEDVLISANTNSGIHLYDISNPAFPAPASSLNNEGDIKDIDKVGDFLFLADRGLQEGRNDPFIGGGLRVVDVSDPENPVEVSCTDTPGACMDMDISNNYAYIADREAGLSIYDITVPDSPQYVGGCGIMNRAACIAIDDTIAYVYNLDENFTSLGVFSISVADPANPYLLDFLAEGSSTTDHMVIHENHLYIANWRGGLRVVDISDPENMVSIENYLGGWPLGLDVDGDLLYVVRMSGDVNGSKLDVYDIADPHDIVLLAQYQTPGGAYDVQVINGLAYVANGYAGFHILDVSNLDDIHEIDFFDTPARADGILVDEEIAYIGNMTSLILLDLSDVSVDEKAVSSSLPTGINISSIYPNPFNPETNITIELENQTFVNVSIFDILGRKVATLHNAFLEQGSHNFSFDASSFASGNYYVKVDSKGYGQVVRSLSLIR